MVEFGFISLYTGCVRGWWREGLLCTWQDHAYTGRQAMHRYVRADTTQGGAWLQSDNFRLGRTGLSDGLTWMLVKVEDGGDFSDDDIGV